MDQEAVLQDKPASELIDPFWKSVELPHQEDDSEFEFVNRVVTAEWFAKSTATIAQLGGLAEVLEEEIANLKVHLRRATHELAQFKSKVLSKNYATMTKSANPIVQDAFFRSLVEDTEQAVELAGLEDKIEELRRLIEVREPRRDQFYTRLKSLKDSQESARQYLDNAKLEARIQAASNGSRI